ncbi:MAG: molybdate ABC transporter substrate-binding protein [Anaeromyxobacter sp. RBG_16_69_14]|nr:MAG: molybdate ABC transporter substrate-binding protein [Anaeromyxobacter sp. RBG_16_69_14]
MRGSSLVLALAAASGAALPALARSGDAPRAVSVAVAANLKPAFEEIAAEWKAKNHGVEVRATYGSSGNFFSQIANGAPFDLFLAADAEFPARVVEKGLAEGKAFTYAYGKLVVWVPKGSPLDFDRRGLAAVTDPTVKRIAIASPQLAPYGRAAQAALQAAGVYDAVKDRIVLGQTVSQAAQFVESGNAQIGFLPQSLASVPPLSDEGRSWLVPPSIYPRIEQAGVVLKGAKSATLARALAAFITGAAGRAALEKHGYALPPG